MQSDCSAVLVCVWFNLRMRQVSLVVLSHIRACFTPPATCVFVLYSAADLKWA